MVPDGIAIRPDLQIGNKMLAVGLTGEWVADDQAVQRLGSNLRDYLQEVVRTSSIRDVVLDLRNVEFDSVDGLWQIRTLQRRLRADFCGLILLVSDPHVREVLAGTELDRHCWVVANEGELQALMRGEPIRKPVPGGGEIPPPFTAEELAEIEATGGTLDEIIREIKETMRKALPSI